MRKTSEARLQNIYTTGLSNVSVDDGGSIGTRGGKVGHARLNVLYDGNGVAGRHNG